MGTFSKRAKINEDMVVFKGVDKEGKPIFGMSIPDLKVGQPVSVGVPDKNRASGFTFVPAWILSKIKTRDTEMDMYQVTFGKKSKRERAVISMTNIHAACLAK